MQIIEVAVPWRCALRHALTNVYRRGWRPDMVHTGDTLSIDIAPMRTGEDGGYVKTFITKEGKEF